ncbi:MAG: RHS repeat-associated core domain-containing protein [Clostridia bacterium]|nr:RHS repeat-associated core domain-containing protein [Clostridia bacterium]
MLTMSTGPMASGAHRLTGKPEDGAAKLYYFGARHYDPQIGRFIGRDPAKDGPNWYAYVSMNPIACVDHDGLREAMGADLREERDLCQQERFASQATDAFVNAALDMAETRFGTFTAPVTQARYGIR